jgi:nucleoside-diphosphate-sugar epimerase
MTFNKTVAVLGSSGNVGKKVVKDLLEQGYKVKAVSSSLKSDLFDKNDNLELVKCDYYDSEELYEVIKDVDAVIICNAIEYKTKVWQEKWPKLAKSIVRANMGAKKRIIFLDNVYNYGYVHGKMTEETSSNPISKKGVVRLEVNQIFFDAINNNQMSIVMAKSAEFYGEGVETSLLGNRFFEKIIKNNEIEFIGDPKKVHSYTYIPDISKALIKLCFSDYTGVVHLPTFYPPITGNQIKSILEEASKKKLKTVVINKTMAKILGLFVPILKEFGEMFYQYENDYHFDSTKFEKMYPDFEVTPYHKGFTDTYNWYLKNI